MLGIYMTPQILQDEYRFSQSGTYYSPAESTLESVLGYFDALPIAGIVKLHVMISIRTY